MNLSYLRKQIERMLKGQFPNAIWYLLGLLTLPLLTAVASLVFKIPYNALGVLVIVLFIVVLVLSVWLILLFDRYNQAMRFIKAQYPNINLDGLEEEEKAFNEDDDS